MFAHLGIAPMVVMLALFLVLIAVLAYAKWPVSKCRIGFLSEVPTSPSSQPA
jgi:hypothetical protein